MNAQNSFDLIKTVQLGEFEDARLEVTRAQKGLPQHLYETISSFANQSEGGAIVLGIDESKRFTLTGGENIQIVIADLTDLAGKMDLPLALDVQII